VEGLTSLFESLRPILLKGILETLYMVVVSTFFSYALGLPAGILLAVSDPDGIHPMKTLNRTLGIVVNLIRSVPFVILLVAIMPFTRFVTGTTLGSTATIVPLVVGAAPFIARMVESSLNEIDRGVIEAAQAMGATRTRIVFRVLLPEARSSLTTGAAITLTTILGYSAMSGFVGGGGLGSIAINYGYYRYQTDIMLATVLFLVVIVQLFQEAGTRLARQLDKRLRGDDQADPVKNHKNRRNI